MICLATDPDAPTVTIDELPDSNRFATDRDEEQCSGTLPLWQSRQVATLDWPQNDELETKPTLTRLFWRGIVAQWPLASRQAWGDRANELQDNGLDWKTAERKAFEEAMKRRPLSPV